MRRTLCLIIAVSYVLAGSLTALENSLHGRSAVIAPAAALFVCILAAVLAINMLIIARLEHAPLGRPFLVVLISLPPLAIVSDLLIRAV